MEKEIFVKEAARQVATISEWMLSFLKETNLESEFAKWVAKNRSEEIVEMVVLVLGSKTGASLEHLIGVVKRLNKEG